MLAIRKLYLYYNYEKYFKITSKIYQNLILNLLEVNLILGLKFIININKE